MSSTITTYPETYLYGFRGEDLTLTNPSIIYRPVVSNAAGTFSIIRIPCTVQNPTDGTTEDLLAIYQQQKKEDLKS